MPMLSTGKDALKRKYTCARVITLSLSCSVLAPGCAEQRPETQEIIDNLVNAGFPADDIMVVDDLVYVGRDTEVSLAASREMLQPADGSEEQYRTANTVSTSLTKICIDGSTFTGVFSSALDLAIQNYDEQPLSFAMARTPSSGCSFTINAVIAPGAPGGSSGAPSGGLPYSTVTIHDELATYSVDTIEHVITHELGHAIGLRHSDYYNRSISCGAGASEGDAGVGAIHVPGTPTDATVGGSIMNSCFRTSETGEFTASDLTALKVLYTLEGEILATADFDRDGQSDILWRNGTTGTVTIWLMTNGSIRTRAPVSTGVNGWEIQGTGDFNGDGKADILWRHTDGTVAIHFMNGVTVAGIAFPWGAGGDNNWQIQGTGDFDGDGKTDILWRYVDGGAAIHFMNGGTVAGIAFPWGAGGDNNWQIQGIADFNGDGKADILWRYIDGGAAIHFMNGGTVAGYAYPWGAGGDNNWQIQGTGRLNNDAKADVLWRHVNGTVAIHFMNGGTVAGQAYPYVPF